MDHSYRILSPRLLLRPLTEHDLDQVRSWRNQEHIRIWFQDDHVIEPEQHFNWYERYRTNDSDMMFIAVRLDKEKPIGTAALYRINPYKRRAEFGRVLIGDSESQGQSYGEEIVKAVTQFGLNTLGLQSIELFVKVTNTRAIRIYMNCGYVHDSSYRHPVAQGSSALIRMVCFASKRRREGRGS
ncbi:GNAT family N-acetyltransferase [Paenibacillus sp. ACRRX]|uniref:GNAT family N-acetyltransferase n=1 Tax=Paenibacillus sp. ACRRX TaxID=2918206 RepID=UPI001EF509AC|nr:GNAT family N-acetyltransferase [Paenibacillus sp. ACRRX]MCG7405984.1 GNAT family N-acetyltransferase [Paenibacillus sp. ACRRX]